MNMDRVDVKRDFKQGISGEDARRKREDSRLSMRKRDRKEQLHKRRMGLDKKAVFEGVGETSMFSSSAQFRNSEVEIHEPQDPEVLRRLKDLPEILNGINSNNRQLQYEKTMQVRKMLSIEMNPPIQPIIDAGIVPKLVNFLGCADNAGLQFEASWALTNIASGTTEHTRVVINHGAVPIFISLLASPSDDVREQAVWALGNIAGDSTECRNMVLEAGILEPLLFLCQQDSKLSLLRNATWTLSNLCRGKPQVPFSAIKSSLPVLSKLLYSSDNEVLTDACWAFSYISDDTGPQNEKIAAVLQSNAVPRLTHLLGHNSNNVKHPALRTIGNIVTGNDNQTQVVINNTALPRLLVLLTNDKKAIRKEACWTISNITAGSVEQIEAVIKNNLFQPVINLLKKGEFDVKKEAAWAVSNATSGGSPEQIRLLVSLDVIPALCDLLNSNNIKVIMVALEGLENILNVGENDKGRTQGRNLFARAVEECGGLDSLEHLQTVEIVGDDIYDRLIIIIRKYFGGDQEDGYVREPEVDSKRNEFQFGGDNVDMAAEEMPGGQTGFSF